MAETASGQLRRANRQAMAEYARCIHHQQWRKAAWTLLEHLDVLHTLHHGADHSDQYDNGDDDDRDERVDAFELHPPKEADSIQRMQMLDRDVLFEKTRAQTLLTLMNAMRVARMKWVFNEEETEGPRIRRTWREISDDYTCTMARLHLVHIVHQSVRHFTPVDSLTMFLRHGLYAEAIAFNQSLRLPLQPIVRHLAERLIQLQSNTLSPHMKRKAIVAGDLVPDQTDPIAIGWSLLYSILVKKAFVLTKPESYLDLRAAVVEAMLSTDPTVHLPQWLRMLDATEGVAAIWHHAESLCRLLLQFGQPERALQYFKDAADYAKACAVRLSRAEQQRLAGHLPLRLLEQMMQQIESQPGAQLIPARQIHAWLKAEVV